MLCGVGIGLDSARLLATGLAVVKHMDRLSGQPSFRACGQTDALSGEILSGWPTEPDSMTPRVRSGQGASWQLDRDPHETWKSPVGLFMWSHLGTLSGPIWSTDNSLGRKQA